MTLSVICVLNPLTIAMASIIIAIDNATAMTATLIAGELPLPDEDKFIRWDMNHV